MNKPVYVRVWKDLDLEDIEKHLLIAGDPTGDCANCKDVGINIRDAKSCPKCNTQFKYIATRVGSTVVQAKRLKTKRPDLIAIEFLDFKNAKARSQAHKFME